MSVNFSVWWSSIIVFALRLLKITLKCTFTQFCHFFFRNKHKSHIYQCIILKFWRLCFHWWNMIPWKAHPDAPKTLDSTSKTEVPVYFEQGCIIWRWRNEPNCSHLILRVLVPSAWTGFLVILCSFTQDISVNIP